jgi:hypothetical protein
VKEERKRLEGEAVLHVDLLRRAVPVVRTPTGLRAVSKDKPVTPESVQRYLVSKFRAYELYEQFRPAVPPGVMGWGAIGEFNLDELRSLARAQ